MKKPDWADKSAKRLAPWEGSGEKVIARALRAAYRKGAKDEREAAVQIVRAGCTHNGGHAVPCPHCWDSMEAIRARGKR